MLDDRIQRTQLTADEWTLGRVDAPVTILEYGDFECPHCAMARPVLEAVVAQAPDTVRLVFRNFPLSGVHPHAVPAAEAAEAAGAQGKFWKMHDMLFTHQDQLGYADLRTYAEAIGLDLQRFDAEMAAHVHLPEVRADFRRGVEDGVNGTPTLFLDRRRYDGPRDPVAMLAVIAALAKGEHSGRGPR